jgi:hypothetical protein
MIVRCLLDGVDLLRAVEQSLEYLDGYIGLDTFETTQAIQQALDAAVLMEPSPRRSRHSDEAGPLRKPSPSASTPPWFTSTTSRPRCCSPSTTVATPTRRERSPATCSVPAHALGGMPDAWIRENEVTAFASDLSLRLVGAKVP